MMPFLSQRELAADIRSKAEKNYRKQLRAALLTPGLSAAQRMDIRSRLDWVGAPKVYNAASPPLPGAIVLPPVLDPTMMRGLKKGELIVLAKQHEVSATGTKAALLDRLLAL